MAFVRDLSLRQIPPFETVISELAASKLAAPLPKEGHGLRVLPQRR
jgi:hypothetical protein